MAEVVVDTTIVGQKVHRVVRRDVLGVLGYEICTGVGQRAPSRDERAGLPITVGHSDSIVRPYSYIVTVNPELSRVQLVSQWDAVRDEPYVLLFSCMYTNGSKLTSQ